ncbi:MAG: hypothetical protein ACI837_002073 [Crocinitomicaceae bacterium]|jgi:hypothetical protein
MSGTVKISAENQLLQARKAGLEEARETFTMQAHGKISGMDVFSWVNPDAETLNTVLNSMPFKVIWMGTVVQLNELLRFNGRGLENVESLVIYDASELTTDFNWLKSEVNVACVDGVDEAMTLLGAMKKEERVFLWTLPRDNWKRAKEIIKSRLQTWN